jgi:hypothetical protein
MLHRRFSLPSVPRKLILGIYAREVSESFLDKSL